MVCRRWSIFNYELFNGYMAAPIVYGDVETTSPDGKTELISQLSSRVKVTLNRFEGNNYVHINSMEKSISVTWEEYEDICGLKTDLQGKLHLLSELDSFRLLAPHMDNQPTPVPPESMHI